MCSDILQKYSSSSPLISMIGFGRNDGYSPHYMDRVRASLLHTQKLAEKHGLPIEIILVEWNPVEGDKLFVEELDDVHSSKFTTIRIITVPAKYHKGFRGADEKGIHLLKALNVGLRRARGQFVTPISTDVFFTDEVFEELAANPLDKDTVYRLDRWDFKADKEDIMRIATQPLEALLSLVDPHVVQHHAPLDESAVKFFGMKPLHTNASGDFLLFSRERWQKLCGYDETSDAACLDGDSLMLHAVVIDGATEKRLSDKARVYKPVHGMMTGRKVSSTEKPWQVAMERFLWRRGMSQVAHKWLRGIFNYPKRQVNGLKGNFASLERNYVLPIYLWTLFPSTVKVGPKKWGLPGADVTEHTL
ncbi:MAG: hypothetical protein JKY34_15360 [Kordiimonadaceae bacterium]|nr:hypothetical protein [Kordiimonadaceae bacterium]